MAEFKAGDRVKVRYRGKDEIAVVRAVWVSYRLDIERLSVWTEKRAAEMTLIDSDGKDKPNAKA